MKIDLRLIFFAIWTTSIAIFSCGDANDNESYNGVSDDPTIKATQKLEKEVIEVHDEIMPKMAVLNNTRVKLLRIKDIKNLSAEDRAALNLTIVDLEEADSLMWDWMHNYIRPVYTGNLDSVQNYLKKEKITVSIMKEKFMSSMAEGEALLIKYRRDGH
jgi:hypothetical protein